MRTCNETKCKCSETLRRSVLRATALVYCVLRTTANYIVWCWQAQSCSLTAGLDRQRYGGDCGGRRRRSARLALAHAPREPPCTAVSTVTCLLHRNVYFFIIIVVVLLHSTAAPKYRHKYFSNSKQKMCSDSEHVNSHGLRCPNKIVKQNDHR